MKSQVSRAKYFLLPLLAGAAFHAQSAVIGFDPNVGAVDVGETVEIDLTISGLGGTGPSSFISGFDLDISFDDSLLAYGGFEFGTGLDTFGFGANIQFATDLGFGSVNVFEISFDFDSDLEAFQPDAFSLGTFTFTGLAEGTSALDVSAPLFGVGLSGGYIFPGTATACDPFFDFGCVASAVPFQVAAGKIRVPEPGLALLFATGVLGLGLQRKLRAKA